MSATFPTREVVVLSLNQTYSRKNWGVHMSRVLLGQIASLGKYDGLIDLDSLERAEPYL